MEVGILRLILTNSFSHVILVFLVHINGVLLE